jgi:glycine/D-amino acid oxidase-like deaminating enzyme
MVEKDAVVVGARCAGSTLALQLARSGLDVLMVDGDTFPSETISTHLLFRTRLPASRRWELSKRGLSKVPAGLKLTAAALPVPARQGLEREPGAG